MFSTNKLNKFIWFECLLHDPVEIFEDEIVGMDGKEFIKVKASPGLQWAAEDYLAAYPEIMKPEDFALTYLGAPWEPQPFQEKVLSSLNRKEEITQLEVGGFCSKEPGGTIMMCTSGEAINSLRSVKPGKMLFIDEESDVE